MALEQLNQDQAPTISEEQESKGTSTEQQSFSQKNPPLHNDPSDVDFKQYLSEDLRNDPSIQKFKDLDSMAKSYIESQKYISQSVRIPTGDASDEQINQFYSKLENVPGVVKIPQTEDEWNNFYNQLGRPQSPDEYRLDIPEDQQVDPETLSTYAETAYNAGLTNEQFARLVERKIEDDNQMVQGLIERREQAAQALKQDWGQEFDRKLNTASEAAKHLAGDKYQEAYEELKNSDLGNNPVVLKALTLSWDVLQENSSNSNAGRATTGGMTPEEAKARISDIMADKGGAYWDAKNPQHKQTVDYVHKLYKLTNPN